jgi:hypothetical protein
MDNKGTTKLLSIPGKGMLKQLTEIIIRKPLNAHIAFIIITSVESNPLHTGLLLKIPHE